MSNEWILDLLTDLRGVAEKNAMFGLAEHLDDALMIAAQEMRSESANHLPVGDDDELDDGFPGQTRSHEFT